MTTEPNHSSSAEIVDNKNNELLVRAQQFSGPIPHPEILELYNKVVPGAAERILKKFESQTEHRIKIESQTIFTANLKEILGVLFGFIITMTTIIGGIYVSLEGKTFLGGSLSFAGLALIVYAFVTGRRMHKESD